MDRGIAPDRHAAAGAAVIADLLTRLATVEIAADDDRGLVDVVAWCERLKGAAAAVQARATVQFLDRRIAAADNSDECRPPQADHSGRTAQTDRPDVLPAPHAGTGPGGCAGGPVSPGRARARAAMLPRSDGPSGRRRQALLPEIEVRGKAINQAAIEGLSAGSASQLIAMLRHTAENLEHIDAPKPAGPS